MKTVVVGSGSWGTALAQTLCDNDQDVIIYGVNEEEVHDINENHKNSKYFGDVELNKKLKATTDLSVVKDADVVLLAVPTIAIEPICKEIDPLLTKKSLLSMWRKDSIRKRMNVFRKSFAAASQKIIYQVWFH